MQNRFDASEFHVGPIPGPPIVKRFGWRLNEFAEESPFNLAESRSYDNGRTDYFVKYCVFGPDSGSIFNPFTPGFLWVSVEDTDTATGRHRYEYSSVSKAEFDSFIIFLETGHVGHLHDAERLARA